MRDASHLRLNSVSNSSEMWSGTSKVHWKRRRLCVRCTSPNEQIMFVFSLTKMQISPHHGHWVMFSDLNRVVNPLKNMSTISPWTAADYCGWKIETSARLSVHSVFKAAVRNISNWKLCFELSRKCVTSVGWPPAGRISALNFFLPRTAAALDWSSSGERNYRAFQQANRLLLYIHLNRESRQIYY